MPIQYVGSRRMTGPSSTINGFTVPAGTQAGDFLIFMANATTYYGWFENTFSDKGFTLDHINNSQAEGWGNTAIGSKFATSADLSASWIFNAYDDGNRHIEMVMVAYRNVVSKAAFISDDTTYGLAGTRPVSGQDEATKMLVPVLSGAPATKGSWVHLTHGQWNQNYSHSSDSTIFSGATERVDNYGQPMMIGDDLQNKALNSYGRPGWIDQFVPDYTNTFTNGFRINRMFSYGLEEVTNNAPNVPTGLGPTGARGANTITLSATATDPEGNNIWVAFETSTDNANWTQRNGTTVASGGTSTHTVTLAANTTYYLRARAVDTAGLVSGYTGTVTFITNRPPGSPGAFTSPTSGVVVDKIATVSINAATEPDGQALTYQWELSLNGGTTWSTKRTYQAGTSWSYDYTNEIETTNAMWRVTASDGIATSSSVTSSTFVVLHQSYGLAMMV